MISLSCETLAGQGKTAQTLMFVGYGLAAALTATSFGSFINDKPSHDDRMALTCAPNLLALGAACVFRF
jgi:hypothetical protein